MLYAIFFIIGQLIRISFTGLGIYLLSAVIGHCDLKSLSYGDCFGIAAALSVIYTGLTFDPDAKKK